MAPVITLVFVLLVLAVPICAAFAMAAFFGANWNGLSLDTFSSLPYQTVNSFLLLSIPFFILTGVIMNQGKLIGRLIDLAEMLLFWLKGMLGYVTIIASAFIGAITGSSVATVAAVGSIIGNRMVDKGYKRGYVAALTGSCGLLGVLIPPSIPLIVYGAAVGTSISDLFLATLVPGILMVFAFFIVHFLLLKRVLTNPAGEKASDEEPVFRQKKRITFIQSIPVLIMPVIVLGGIYGGIFTPTEAAAVACVYGLIVAVFGKTLKMRDLSDVFFKSAMTSVSILCIIAFTSVFNKYMILQQVPQSLTDSILNLTNDKVLFLIIVNLALFLVGMFMETNAAVLLMGPLLYPAAIKFGMDPIHFGIILVTNIELGLITPPMAANLFVAAKTNRSSLVEMLPYVGWFFLAAAVVLGFITFVPGLSIWFK
jgi:C4-dicarboxylate transporter DctM subunit